MIIVFLQFLDRFFGIQKQSCRFGLQIFSDCKPQRVLDFWGKKLGISTEKFYKVTVTQSGSIGTYRKKNQHGVLTIYCSNTKLKKLLDEKLAALAPAYALRDFGWQAGVDHSHVRIFMPP